MVTPFAAKVLHQNGDNIQCSKSVGEGEGKGGGSYVISAVLCVTLDGQILGLPHS